MSNRRTSRLARLDDGRAKLANVTDEASRIDGSSDERIDAAWLAEAKCRLEAYERGELEAVDSDDMMRRLRAKDRRPVRVRHPTT
jgi:hypothetical protein